MNYAIKILQDEKKSIETALNEWESTQYPDAKKEREKRLKDINQAIELIRIMNKTT